MRRDQEGVENVLLEKQLLPGREGGQSIAGRARSRLDLVVQSDQLPAVPLRGGGRSRPDECLEAKCIEVSLEPAIDRDLGLQLTHFGADVGQGWRPIDERIGHVQDVMCAAVVSIGDRFARELEALFGDLACHAEGLAVAGGPRQSQRESKTQCEAQCRDGSTQQGHPGVAPAPSPGTLRRADGSGLDGLTPEESLQVVGQGVSVGVALAGLFLKAFQADRLEIARELGLEPFWRHGLLEADLLERLHHGRPLERWATGQ